MINLPSKSNKQKNYFFNWYFVGVLKVSDDKQDPDPHSRLISQRHESADPDPDPHQNVMDPKHCFSVQIILALWLFANRKLIG
jgi:hypothetical protein